MKSTEYTLLHVLLIVVLASCANVQDSGRDTKGKWIKLRTEGMPALGNLKYERLGGSKVIVESRYFDSLFCKDNALICLGEYDDQREGKEKCIWEVWTLDLKAERWHSNVVSYPEDTRVLSSVFVIAGEKAFLFGGEKSSTKPPTKTNDLWELDLSKICWRKLEPQGERPPPMTGARGYWNGSELVIGFSYNRGFRKEEYEIWKFKPADNKWTKVYQKENYREAVIRQVGKPDGFWEFGYCVGDSKRAFVIIRREVVNMNLIAVFDFATGEWKVEKTGKESPKGRVGADVMWTGKAIFLYGGDAGAEMGPSERLYDLWKYDPEKNSWEKLFDTTPPRGSEFTYAMWADNTKSMYVIGKEVWRYDSE